MDTEKALGRRWAAVLGGITLLALALRLYGLGRYSIWYDESTSLYGLQYVGWDLKFLRGSESPIIPLNSLILFFWHGFVDGLAGVEMGSEQSDFLLRLLPLSFGVATVPMIFVTARYLTGNLVAACIAALFVAVSPLHIYYSQELRPHSLYALLVLAAFYASVRALEEDRRRWWVMSVLFASLSFYAYYFAAFYMVAINVYAFAMYRVYKPVFKKWVVSQFALGLTLVPPLLMALGYYGVHNSAEEHWFPHPNLETIGITVKNYFAGYSSHSSFYWPLFMLACLAMLGGLVSLRSRPRVVVLLLVSGFAPMLVQVAFWSTQSFAFYTYRAQLAFAPSVFILAASGIAWLRPNWLRALAVGLMALLTVPALADHYAQRMHPMIHHRLGARHKVGNRPAAEYINANWREGDFVAHATTATLSPFLYHYMDHDQAFAALTDEEWQNHLKSFPDTKVWEDIGFFPRRIDEIFGVANRVWYVESWWEPTELHPFAHELRAWLDANAARLVEREFDGLTLYLYDKDPKLREELATMWAADLGEVEIPYYEFVGMAADGDMVARWRESFDVVFPPVASRDGLAIDTWLDPLEQGVFREVNMDGYRALCHLANRGPLSREVSLKVYGAEKVVRTLSFRRELDSNSWRPAHSHYGKVALRARLNDSESSGRIEQEVSLAEGAYDVYVQMYRDVGLRNERRGALTLSLVGRHSERTPVGRAHGHVAEGESGWRWVRLGEIGSDGAAITLELVADNPDGLPEAQVDIDRLMFVPVSATSGEMPEPVQDETFTLEPFAQRGVEIVGSLSKGRAEEIYIEIYEGENEVFRNLSFVVAPKR